jgi:phosphoglycerate dehydrogenase-like enzyme
VNSRPAVFILDRDAHDYLPLLEGLARQGVELSTAISPVSARAAWAGQPVVLGQPDLVASALAGMPGVRWVQSTWAGVTPLLKLERRDFLLTGVKGVFGPQMAEYVLGVLLARELRLAERREHQDRRDWWPADSGSLQGKTLGVMGSGSIGRCIAARAAAFGLRVIGCSRRGGSVDGFERMFPVERLDEFLPLADYLVCVLPDTPETSGLLGAQAFRVMRNSCCLVNVGRGNVIDEAALVEALHQGEIAGAVLDVFREEPLPTGSPLWDAPGLTLTAHVAAKSHPPEIARIFVDNYNRFVAGEPLLYPIDFERGY